MDQYKDDTPNPGSREAVTSGCRCPVLDNHYGTGAYSKDKVPQFWISEECPIHGNQPQPKGN